VESRLGSGALVNGVIDGQTLTWTLAMKLPTPLLAEFPATIEANAISGHVTLGSYGKAPFKGNRTQDVVGIPEP
jgi:hypothetical protein